MDIFSYGYIFSYESWIYLSYTYSLAMDHGYILAMDIV